MKPRAQQELRAALNLIMEYGITPVVSKEGIKKFESCRPIVDRLMLFEKLKPAMLSDEEEARRGAAIAEFLNLKRSREHPDRWDIPGGNTKTDVGLFRIMRRMVEGGE